MCDRGKETGDGLHSGNNNYYVSYNNAIVTVYLSLQGVMLSHDNLTWSATVMCRSYGLTEVRIIINVHV